MWDQSDFLELAGLTWRVLRSERTTSRTDVASADIARSKDNVITASSALSPSTEPYLERLTLHTHTHLSIVSYCASANILIEEYSKAGPAVWNLFLLCCTLDCVLHLIKHH